MKKVYTIVIYLFEIINDMASAKIFQNGRSQAVRLPKEFWLQSKEVKISKLGNKIILELIENSWEQWFESFKQFPDDSLANGREQRKNGIGMGLDAQLLTGYQCLHLPDKKTPAGRWHVFNKFNSSNYT